MHALMQTLVTKALDLDNLKQRLFLTYGRRNGERILKACINISQRFETSPEDVFQAWISPFRECQMPRFEKHKHRHKMSKTDYITNCIKMKKMGLL